MKPVGPVLGIQATEDDLILLLYWKHPSRRVTKMGFLQTPLVLSASVLWTWVLKCSQLSLNGLNRQTNWSHYESCYRSLLNENYFSLTTKTSLAQTEW